jgi:hypothetical protein
MKVGNSNHGGRMKSTSKCAGSIVDSEVVIWYRTDKHEREIAYLYKLEVKIPNCLIISKL